MMNEPLISIGLPTYNRADDLKACLANLTGLDYKNIEIIISDNHSTDATVDVCKEYVKKDRRLRYYRQTKNQGPEKNSQFVLEKAKGKYFFWASDDDIRNSRYLSSLVPLMEKYPKAVIAITDTTLFTDKRSYLIPLFFSFYTRSILALFTYIKHPDCVSVILYGLHRMSPELKRSHKKTSNELRKFNIKGYDNSFAVVCLLEGDLLYIKRPLFHIRDNGMYLSVYKNLSSLNFSENLFLKVKRYLLFPVMFYYDWVFALLYIYQSKKHFYVKVLLMFIFSIKLLSDILNFIITIIKGFLIILKSSLSHLFDIFFRKIKRPQP